MIKYLYIIWATAVFLLVFIKDRLSSDNIAHIGIILFFFATLIFYKKFQKEKTINSPKFFFITCSLLFAAIVEGLYMIHEPVLPSLKITADMSPSTMLQNYGIDLLFTMPAYVLIFAGIWWLINKYKYSFWEFAILMAVGQALGDGSRTFLSNPGLLLFIPYVMINYHAMTVVPFLKIHNQLSPQRIKSAWRFIAPLILLPATYVFCGMIIYTIAGAFGLK